MTVLKANIKFEIQFEQWRLLKNTVKVRYFWFHFTRGIEVWELLFPDGETRTFCVTVGVIHLVDTSQSNESLSPLPFIRTRKFTLHPLCIVFLTIWPHHFYSKSFACPINNPIGKVILIVLMPVPYPSTVCSYTWHNNIYGLKTNYVWLR